MTCMDYDSENAQVTPAGDATTVSGFYTSIKSTVAAAAVDGRRKIIVSLTRLSLRRLERSERPDMVRTPADRR
jgi:hypothetical protein